MVERLNNTGHNGQRFLSEASFGRSTLANSSKHRAPRLILTWNEEIPTGSLRNQPLPLPLLSFSHSFSPLSSFLITCSLVRYQKTSKTRIRDESRNHEVRSLTCWSLKVYTGNDSKRNFERDYREPITRFCAGERRV